MQQEFSLIKIVIGLLRIISNGRRKEYISSLIYNFLSFAESVERKNSGWLDLNHVILVEVAKVADYMERDHLLDLIIEV